MKILIFTCYLMKHFKYYTNIIIFTFVCMYCYYVIFIDLSDLFYVGQLFFSFNSFTLNSSVC